MRQGSETSSGTRTDAEEKSLFQQKHSFFPPSIVKMIVLAGKSMEVIQSLLKSESGKEQRYFPLRRLFTSPLYADFVESLVKANAASAMATMATTTTTTTKKLRFASPAAESVSLEGDDLSGDGVSHEDSINREVVVPSRGDPPEGRGEAQVGRGRSRSYNRGSIASQRTRSVGDARLDEPQWVGITWKPMILSS